MGSMQSSMSSFVSTTAASLRRSEAASGSGGRLNALSGPGRAPDLAADNQPSSFELSLATSELSLVLWYPQVR